MGPLHRIRWPSPSSNRQWFLRLAIIAAIGMTIRVVYILAFKNPSPLLGDGSYYHRAANLLARGHGFIQPDLYRLRFFLGPAAGHTAVADHPPGYIIFLAVPSWFGLDSPLDHQLWSAMAGTATIIVIGLAGRRIASPATGLVAALLAAVYPNFWINDGLVMSETLVLLTAGLTVLAAYQFYERPFPKWAAALGLATAGFVFTRAEGLLLLGLLLVPLCLGRRLAWRRRLLLLAVAEAAAVGAILPWTVYNLSRFKKPVPVSTGLGFAMATANCDLTYHGKFVGYWVYGCGANGPRIKGDVSEVDVARRQRAIRYMGDHAGQLPAVVGARLGRTWGFFRPSQQLRFDYMETSRDVPPSWVGLVMYWAMIPTAIAGVVILRRRGLPLSPMWSLALTVTVASITTFGQTRYRTAAEVPLVLLAAVAIQPRRVLYAGPDRQEDVDGHVAQSDALLGTRTRRGVRRL